jgi:hypothetical protein
MKRVIPLLLLFGTSAAGAQADCQQLMRGYRDTFRTLGRAEVCKVDIGGQTFLQEVIRRHGEGSEAVSIARIAFAAAASNTLMPRELDPTPPSPMPCDVIVYMKDMRLPDLPPH